jgi:hypothetical protein
MSVMSKDVRLHKPGEKIAKKPWDVRMESFGGILYRENVLADYLIPPLVEDIFPLLITTWNKTEGRSFLVIIDTRTAFNLYDNKDATTILNMEDSPKDKDMELKHKKYLKEVKNALNNISTWYQETTQEISRLAYEPKVSSSRKVQEGLRKAISKRIETMGY